MAVCRARPCIKPDFSSQDGTMGAGGVRQGGDERDREAPPLEGSPAGIGRAAAARLAL